MSVRLLLREREQSAVELANGLDDHFELFGQQATSQRDGWEALATDPPGDGVSSNPRIQIDLCLEASRERPPLQ